MLLTRRVLQVLSTALVKAERENATVYLQRVPNFADLPPIQPYILVKSLSLPDIDAAGETLFQTVIPDNRYSLRYDPSCTVTASCVVQCPELVTAASTLSVL